MNIDRARRVLLELEQTLLSTACKNVKSQNIELSCRFAQEAFDALVCVRQYTNGEYGDFDSIADRIREAIMKSAYEIAEGMSETITDAIREKFQEDA